MDKKLTSSNPPGLRVKILFIGMVSLFAVIVPMLFMNISSNWSNSIEEDIFWLQKGGIPQKGDFIFFKRRITAIDPDQDITLVKKAVCVSGEYLIVGPNWVFCGGIYLGKIYPGLQPALFFGVIPKGKVFAMSTALDSYDSRYFGLINEEEIYAISKHAF